MVMIIFNTLTSDVKNVVESKISLPPILTKTDSIVSSINYLFFLRVKFFVNFLNQSFIDRANYLYIAC